MSYGIDTMILIRTLQPINYLLSLSTAKGPLVLWTQNNKTPFVSSRPLLKQLGMSCDVM